jgi:hypothetical protein
MAFDWIKIRTDLYRDPKVSVIADLMLDQDSELSRFVNQNMQCNMTVTRNVMRNVTVGALVSVWGVLRHRGKRNEYDLFVKCCTLSVVDDLADLPGFGYAMASVGWIEETEEGIVLPRFFEEFNVDPAEENKSKNAERQRLYRERKKEESNVTRDVTVASQSNAREEKRREENISTSLRSVDTLPRPESVSSENWDAFIEVRKGLKAKNTLRAINSLITQLGKLQAEGHEPNAVVEQSIRSSWKDLYPIRQQFRGSPSSTNRMSAVERQIEMANQMFGGSQDGTGRIIDVPQD